MEELEQRLRKELRQVPGAGLTKELQDRIVHRSYQAPAVERRRVRRSITSLAAAAAAVVVVAGGTFLYTHGQPASKVSQHTTARPTHAAANPFQAATIKLLSQYGWKPNFTQQMTQKLTLPKSYVDAPGAYPEGLYWAYHNVLSKNAGLDMTPYLGTPVTVHMIPVQHWTVGVPSYDENTTFAVTVESNGKVIGAWISQGIHVTNVSASLSKHFFAELTGQTWDEWLQYTGIVDYKHGVEAQRKNWTPEQVIRAYFDALNQKDYQTAWSLMTKASQYDMMSVNVPQGKLYNSGFDPDGYAEHNIQSVHVTQIQLRNIPTVNRGDTTNVTPREQQIERDLFNRWTYDKHEYRVSVDEKFKQAIARGNGPGVWYVTVVRESRNAPWKIAGIGSGP